MWIYMDAHIQSGPVAESTPVAGRLPLLGERLCLDFCNTADWRGTKDAHDFLGSYPDLVAWSRHVGLLSADEERQLLGEAELRPENAAAALERTVVLREALHRIFSAVAKGDAPPGDDLAVLNTVLSEAMARARIRPSEGGFEWDWEGAKYELDWMLWPVARSAAELLDSDRLLGRVKQCTGGCSWLFVDTTKNGSRRWCTMAVCGNRAKARRYYRRRKRDAD